MHVAVVDIGTNSTRLLIADVEDGAIAELDRRSIVTRLGEGVDATGRLADEAMERVFATLAEYRERDRRSRRAADARIAVADERGRATPPTAPTFTRRVRERLRPRRAHDRRRRGGAR